jgi:streptogramin lyase
MPRPADGEGRRRALVVATGAYADATLAGLRAPGRDAVELATVLEDAAVGGFDVESVLDVPADLLRRRVARFCADGGPGDLALLYISCHGLLDDRGRLYYATTDTDHELLGATAIPASWLNEQLDDCRCRRQIVILDCCHSGAFAKGAKGTGALALQERFEGRGRVVLTASRATEYAFEGDRVLGDGVSSVFTDVLVKGLRSGDADRDGDGIVTVTELYDYAYDAVRSRDGRQTPMLWTYGAEGGLVVAQSARGPVVRAASEDANTPESPEPPAPPSGRGPSRRALIAAGALVAVLAAVAVITLLPGSDSGGDALPAISMGGGPTGIAWGRDAMWIARHDVGAVSWIGAASTVASVDPGLQPQTIAADGKGTVWAGAAGGTALTRIDATARPVKRAKGVVVQRLGSVDMVIAFGALWLGVQEDGTIVKRDLISGHRQETKGVPAGFEGQFAAAVSGPPALWAVGTQDETHGPAWVGRVGLHQQYAARYVLKDLVHPSGVAFGAGAVWIADDQTNTVVRFDPESREASAPIDVTDGITSDDIVAVADAVLLWNPTEGKLTRIDPETRKVVGTIGVSGYTTGAGRNLDSSTLAVADGVAWVTDPVGDQVLRIKY